MNDFHIPKYFGSWYQYKRGNVIWTHLWLIVSLHASHRHWWSPVRTWWCTYRLPVSMKALLHKTHPYGHSPVCNNAVTSGYVSLTALLHSDMDTLQYVNFDVSSDNLCVCFITHITGIWMLCSMHTLMYLQITFWTECLFTQITAIWTLPSMYTLMYIQITFWTECLFTQITAK
jgi:hypothetical protein